MDFREFGELRMRRPSVEPDEPAELSEEFELDSVKIGPGDHSGLIGAGSLAHSLLTGVDLSGARLEPLELTDVTLDRANLSNAMLLRTTARRVELLGCQAIGLQLGLEQGNEVYAENCRFDHATIRVDKIRGAMVFAECSFRETVFAGDLSRVRFLHCELAATEFETTGATDCDLRSSRLSNVRGLGNLRGATISTEQALSVATILATETGLTVAD